MVTPFYQRSPTELYVVRLYDHFDGWLDITGPLIEADALAYWNKETANGTKMTGYNDGDYWAIFPAGTRMLDTPESRGR